MKVVIGLGNPGTQYENTRHNVGFTALNYMALEYGFSFKKKFLKPYEYATYNNSFLVKPLTYMNNSGQIIQYIKNECSDLNDIVVICDNLDLPCGAVRVRFGGSNSGQKGLKSIQDNLGSSDFIRIYIGIGRPDFKSEINSYVLKRESRSLYRDELLNAIKTSSLIVHDFINGTKIADLQNEYTRKGIS